MTGEMGNGAVARRGVGRALKRGIVCSGASALALVMAAGPASGLPLNYAGLVWNVDRYAPDTVQVLASQYGRTNVLRIAFGPNGDPLNRGLLSGSFWQYQGIQAPTNLPGGTKAFFEVDMWIPTGWAVNIPGGSVEDPNPPGNFLATIISDRTHVDAALWVEIPANQPPGFGAYPTWGYLNDELYSGSSTPGPIVFDGDLGNLNAPTAGAINFGAWNTFRMEYQDTEMRFFLNGVLAYTHVWTDADITLAGDPNNTIKTVFLNQFHYDTPGPAGTNYNSYSAAMFDYWNFFYSNLNYGVINDGASNLNALLNINADIEVKAGGNLTVAGGSGTTGSEGNLIVLTGGQIKGGAAGNPYLVSGAAFVQPGGTFGGWANVAGTVTNLGVLSPGNSPGIMNFGGFVAGGSALVEVQFNNAGAPVNGVTHDFINITGNVSGGTTILNIVPISPSGAPVPTTGNGIELVRVGGTVSASNFALAAPVVVGGYEYLLAYLRDYSGTTDGFFLQSVSRQELALNAGLLSAGRQSLRSCAFRSRGMADLSQTKGLWAGADFDGLNASRSTGVEFESDRGCYGGGVYGVVAPGVQLGFGAGFGSTETTFFLPQGAALADANSWILKGTASYVSGVFFANAGLGYASTNWDVVKAGGAGFAEAKIDGLIGDVEGGIKAGIGRSGALTLAVAALYDGTKCGSNCLVAGAVEDPSEWMGRASSRLEFGFNGGRFRPFVGAAYLTNFDDGNSVALGSAVSQSDASSGLLEVEAGFNVQVHEKLTVSARGGYTEGLDSDVNGFNFGAGLRLAW